MCDEHVGRGVCLPFPRAGKLVIDRSETFPQLLTTTTDRVLAVWRLPIAMNDVNDLSAYSVAPTVKKARG
jgi:hypothetical protein